MKRLTLAILAALWPLFVPGAELRVSAAASLTDVLQEIGPVYEKESGDAILFNFGASSALARQIQEGAPADMFAIVLYVNQPTTDQANAQMGKQTREVIDLTLKHRGTFFLPYQLHYTPEQLRASYPQIDAFFAAKQRYDPTGLLTNTFYERYRKQ